NNAEQDSRDGTTNTKILKEGIQKNVLFGKLIGSFFIRCLFKKCEQIFKHSTGSSRRWDELCSG
ncbi:MAG TPA: hypothetical protein PLB87_12155, partial [Prolixibacteraceae bacterium]|nr:hypothetical protein [Prolixibacteraceae bacterium]